MQAELIRPDLAAFIAGLPKAELHMHIEGSIEPDLLFTLAASNNVALQWNTVEALQRAYAFEDLQSFLAVYYAGCQVMQAEQDFHDVTAAYLKRARQDNVVRCEVFFSPQAHTSRGVPLEAAMNGVTSALKQARLRGLGCGLILNAQRQHPEEDALKMLEATKPWWDQILGYGLGGPELPHPPRKFQQFFRAGREKGFKMTAHAGEEGPAGYVAEAVDLLKVDRIDHGNACLADPALVRRLVASRLPLTVCPLSNLALKGVEDLRHHPLKRMLELGLLATVNSDDPSYFGGYVNRNYERCAQALSLDAADLTLLARNSITACFEEEPWKARWIGAIDQYACDWSRRP